MCTVTYLPLADGGFILTSNRDEAPARATAQVVEAATQQGHRLLFPKDPLSNGSWICVADNGRLICLLNGAFEKHAHQPPYRRSRGLVVLDFFDWPRATDFFERYELDEIEAFTMVCWEQGCLHEFRWDGTKRYHRLLNTQQPWIWSSATLYTTYYCTIRATLFEKWRQSQGKYSQEGIIQFHQSGGVGDPENDFIMNRKNKVRTVSITSIQKESSYFVFKHLDLLSEQHIQKHIEITSTDTALAKD